MAGHSLDGDSPNDVPMFERSGFAIAMGNASPEVRRAADLATASNEEDGFAAAVEHIISLSRRVA